MAILGRLLIVAALTLPASSAHSERLKDIVRLTGVRSNQLSGYGLVVGLKGTGDRRQSTFTVQSLLSMLSRLGVSVDPRAVKVKNVAAVMVTATLRPFARNGDSLDLQVSSIGDAESLQGGTLLLTPLKGADGNVYAVAQGPLSVGGFSAEGRSGSSVRKNHDTVATIPAGATVEREVEVSIADRTELRWVLHRPDFTSATRVATAINTALESTDAATALDGSSISVKVPEAFVGKIAALIAKLEPIDVEIDRTARVVLNERTGTVVLGADVRISRVAIAHGGLTVTVSETFKTSQPAPLSKGKTVVTPESDVEVAEGAGQLAVVEGASLSELVTALNALGVTPRDLVAILQALRASGALQAELEVL